MLPYDVELEVIGAYLPYKTVTGEKERGNSHFARPIARILGDHAGLQLPHFWTLIYILCNVWPSEKDFDFVLPKTIAELPTLNQLVRMRLCSKPDVDGKYSDNYCPYQEYTINGSNPLWWYSVDATSFWQGCGPFFAGTWIPDYYSHPAFSSPYSSLRCHFPFVMNDEDELPGQLDGSQIKTISVALC